LTNIDTISTFRGFRTQSAWIKGLYHIRNTEGIEAKTLICIKASQVAKIQKQT